MANDILDIRKLNVFGGGQNVGENRDPYGNLFPPGPMPPPPPDAPQMQPTNAVDDIMKLYAPETEASTRFRQLLEEYPEREDPSFARRITSMLGGLSTVGTNANNGLAIQNTVLQEPNERRLSDWEKKIRPAEVASSQENQRNVNSRNLAALELRDRQAEAKLASTEKIAADKLEQQKIRDDIARYKAAGWKVEKAGSRIVAVAPPSPTNPTGGYKDLGASNMMDQLDLENLRGEFAQGRAETMAAAASDRAATAAETSRQNAETAGSVVLTDAKTQLPVVVRPRGDQPIQLPVQNATPVTRVPGTKGPSTGPDLARVRGMSNEALNLIKNEVLVMPDPKNPNAKPVINPKVKIATGWGNWDPNRFLPESPQRAAIRTQGRLKDLLTLSLIGEMKEQSRTGATGFGQLTGRELDVLESAASKLDFAQDEATLTTELIRIVEKLELIMKPGPDEQGTSSIQLATKFRQNKRDGRREVSTDGGLTWKPYVPPQQ